MRTCNHCSEYNKFHKMCLITFIIEGEDYQLEIKDPDAPCLLEKEGLLPEIKSVRKWSDGRNGYIEYVTPRQEEKTEDGGR